MVMRQAVSLTTVVRQLASLTRTTSAPRTHAVAAAAAAAAAAAE